MYRQITRHVFVDRATGKDIVPIYKWESVCLPISIYALSDPSTPDIPVYIGQSQDLGCRLIEHISQARTGQETERAAWLRTLFERGVMPVVTVLEVTDAAHVKERERFHVGQHVGNGALVNYVYTPRATMPRAPRGPYRQWCGDVYEVPADKRAQAAI